jgi:hypothetical protein
VDGIVEPMELGHLPYKKHTYEEYVGERGLERWGKDASQSVTLPARLIQVKIILPHFSAPGRYEVAVTRDQAGNDVQANSTVTTTNNGGREELSVDLDLRKAPRRGVIFFLRRTNRIRRLIITPSKSGRIL